MTAKARAHHAATRAKHRGAGKARKAKCNCKKKNCKELYDKHTKQLPDVKEKLSKSQEADVAAFKKNWDANHGRYETVANETGVPAPLVAALHWRESTGNFGTYLHQGDPLGAPARHVPRDIPVFGKDEWEKAAAHAIKQKKACADALGLDKDSRDRGKMAAYAERYNGIGYDMHNTSSPYVYSGTDAYSAGKYTSDGHYDPSYVDQQTGVIPLIDSISQ
jgi:lysozyme family protein